MYQNIIDELNNIVCYLDLYDLLGEIDDDNFRQELDVYIQKAEADAISIDQVIADIKTKLEDYTGEDDIDAVISNIEEAGNNQDLYNIIENIEDSALLSEDAIDSIRQLYKNNRYRSLDEKKETIIKFLRSTTLNPMTESLLLEYSKEDAVQSNDGDIENEDDETLSSEELRDKRIFQSLKDREEDKTLLDLLQDRIGEQMSVGEFNTVLQSLFGQFNRVFLMTGDLYSKDLEQTQSLEIDNDEDLYTINYDIVDMNRGIIEITDAYVE